MMCNHTTPAPHPFPFSAPWSLHAHWKENLPRTILLQLFKLQLKKQKQKKNKKHYSPREKHSTPTLHFSFTLTYNVEKSITNMELSEQI